jgi:hypothetical protein
VPPSGRDEARVREVERRLEEIVNTIQEFAALRFRARAPIGPDSDIVDVVAAGVNFLGEDRHGLLRSHYVGDPDLVDAANEGP